MKSRIRLLPIALALALSLLTVIAGVGCVSAPAEPSNSTNAATVEPEHKIPDDKMTLVVSYSGDEGSELSVDINLEELAVGKDQEVLGYLYKRVYETDDANEVIATARYVDLIDVLQAATSKEGFELGGIWYEGCSLEFTVVTGWDGEQRSFGIYPMYEDFTYEKLMGERYFYEGATRDSSLFVSPMTRVPTVLALSSATEGVGIPAEWLSGTYKDALLANLDGIDLRSDELAPQLLWGLSAEEDNDVTEFRFPTNIVKIRIIPPKST